MYNLFEEIKDIVMPIRHLTGEVQAEWLFDLVKNQTTEDSWICEIGTYHGFLSATIGLACIGSNRRAVVIDHMIGDHCDQVESRATLSLYKEFIDNMISVGVWDKIVPLPFKSFNPSITDHSFLFTTDPGTKIIRELYLSAYEMVLAMGIEFDLIYLDGNHDSPNVLRELELYTTVLKTGGVIAGDDGVMDMMKNWDTLTLEDVPSGPANASFKFFKGNNGFVPIESSPGNQFGFIKVT